MKHLYLEEEKFSVMLDHQCTINMSCIIINFDSVITFAILVLRYYLLLYLTMVFTGHQQENFEKDQLIEKILKYYDKEWAKIGPK